MFETKFTLIKFKSVEIGGQQTVIDETYMQSCALSFCLNRGWRLSSRRQTHTAPSVPRVTSRGYTGDDEDDEDCTAAGMVADDTDDAESSSLDEEIDESMFCWREEGCIMTLSTRAVEAEDEDADEEGEDAGAAGCMKE